MGNFEVNDSDIVLDNLPSDVVASMEVRNAYLNNLGLNSGLVTEFLADDVLKWLPGQKLRVAFRGGNESLHQKIEGIVTEISSFCNLSFDFKQHGAYRTWTEDDTEFKAEIRVCFDHTGYFSLVGTDSTNQNIGDTNARVGGRPYQCSLNLGGFDYQLPASWKGTVLHEFMHAIGFHHAHQNITGPCQDSFRWHDDIGYTPTQDVHGRYIQDSSGKRPGIYTYLAGHPNRWEKHKVDHNLRTHDDSGLTPRVFDSASVMLYRFPEWFYKTHPSPCSPTSDGQSLSDGDKNGLLYLYPYLGDAPQRVEQHTAILNEIKHSAQLESQAEGTFGHLSEIQNILERNLQSIR